MTQTKYIVIHTDGSCLGNPGPGGYGIVLRHGSRRKELSGGYRLTTNNRMELLAAIVALEALKQPCRVTLFSDSKYVVDAMRKGWAEKWRANGWKRNKRDRAENPDLWARLLTLCGEHDVTFRWVKGHANDPENERCDELAKAAAAQPNLPADEGYESRAAPNPRPPKLATEHRESTERVR